jgi:hypothetical protein
VKQRSNAPKVYLGKDRDRRNPSSVATHYGIQDSEYGWMYLGDTGHYGYPDYPNNRDIGGPFWIEKRKTVIQPTQVGTVWTGRNSITYNFDYTGAFLIQPPALTLPSGETKPDAWGAEAYSKMKPAKPEFGLTNYIVELKDLTQMLRLRCQSLLGQIGGNALAYKFGWEPLARDLLKLFELQRAVQNRYKQLLRDEGKPVRRRIKLFESQTDAMTTVVAPSAGNFAPVLNTYYYNGWPTMTHVTKEADRVWASAEFRYWLPGYHEVRDFRWERKLKQALTGDNLNLSTIYNLLPWSWLLDWFTNLGDVVENLETGVADTIHARYFYVMRERALERETFGQIFLKDSTGRPVTFNGSAKQVSSIKRRVAGDPFGFMTDSNTLSAMQLFILGALGLSRVR